MGGNILDKAFNVRAIAKWARAARMAISAELPSLRRQRQQARQLKTHLDKLIHVADERLALPMIGATGFPKPHNADWAWRPELWRGPLATPGISSIQTKSMLGNEVTLFHDCQFSELTLRQLRNRPKRTLHPTVCAWTFFALTDRSCRWYWTCRKRASKGFVAPICCAWM